MQATSRFIGKFSTGSLRVLGCRSTSNLAGLSAERAPKKNVAFKEITIPVPWGHITGKEWGSVDGQPILGIHGWQDNCGTFDPVAALFPKDFHFVAIDLPGHGLSSHRPLGGFYEATDYVVDIRRVIRHLKWSERGFSFVSHSMGSGVSMLYAAAFPSEVKKFVSLDTFRFAVHSVNGLPEKLAKHIDQLLRCEEQQQHVSAEGIEVDIAVQRIMASLNNSVGKPGAQILLKRGAVPTGDTGQKLLFTRDLRLRLFPPSVSEEEYMASIKKLRCDMLVIIASNGIQAPEVQEKYSKLYEESCKSFKVVRIKGTHHAHLNNPELVTPHIIDFLKQ